MPNRSSLLNCIMNVFCANLQCPDLASARLKGVEMTRLLGAFRSLIIQRVCSSFPLSGSILSTTAHHLPSSHQPITQKRTLNAVMDYHFEELESPMAPPASARNHKPLYLNICLRGIESLETQDRDAIISRTSMTALLPLIGC
jgi:hypothetical protein